MYVLLVTFYYALRTGWEGVKGSFVVCPRLECVVSHAWFYACSLFIRVYVAQMSSYMVCVLDVFVFSFNMSPDKQSS